MHQVAHLLAMVFPKRCMDKKLQKKFWTPKRISLYGGTTLFVIAAGYMVISADHRKILRVNKNKLTIAAVRRGEFQEYIPQTGIIEPKRSVQLDAIEGGTIKRLVAESGAMVAAGDVILVLSNLNRELAVREYKSAASNATSVDAK